MSRFLYTTVFQLEQDASPLYAMYLNVQVSPAGLSLGLSRKRVNAGKKQTSYLYGTAIKNRSTFVLSRW